MPQPIHFTAKVTGIVRHTPDVSTYTLESERRLPKFFPGQFIHLSLEKYDSSGFWPESRVFSVASAIHDNRTLRLTIGNQGAYTRKINEQLETGSLVSCKGPYGDFIISHEKYPGKRLVMIAGGTGITPFAAFMEYALMGNDGTTMPETFLFYGARQQDLLIYLDLSESCRKRFPGFRPFYFCEKEDPLQNSLLHMNTGKIDIGFITDTVMPDEHTLFFISGPKAMVDLFSGNLKTLHRISPENVIIDSW